MSESESTLSTYLFTVLRVFMGWIFFWSFIDKTFGLAYEWNAVLLTSADPSSGWIGGGSPTYGFLNFATEGTWFQGVFQPMAGNPLVDFLYMMGMLGVGLAMILGIGRKIAAVSGALMMFLMYLAQLPLANNPFIDDHIVYALVFIILGFTKHYGIVFVPQWKGIAEKYPFLE